MQIDDDTPFGRDATLDVLPMGSMGTLHTQEAADAQKALRARVSLWASERGFLVTDSEIVRKVDAVDVEVPLWSITIGTAAIRAVALERAPGSLSIEPKRWVHRLRDRVRFSAGATGDAEFDQAFHVQASEPAILGRFVDEPARAAIRACSTWFRAIYADGVVQVMLDAEPLTGRHLSSGMDVAAALARASRTRTAYR